VAYGLLISLNCLLNLLVPYRSGQKGLLPTAG
jgi:hypothetical protein